MGKTDPLPDVYDGATIVEFDVLKIVIGSGLSVSKTSDGEVTITSSGGGGGTTPLDFSWDGDIDEGIEFVEDEYEALTCFIFPGTGVFTPTTAKAIALIDDNAETYSLRLYDITNAKEIAEVMNQSNEGKAIVDLGTLANLPSDEAIWEIQGKTSGVEEGHLFALRIA